MKIAMYVFVFIIIAVVAAQAYVRLAPTDASRWHQPITATEDADMAKSAIRVLETSPETFGQVHAAFLALPRTSVLAGTLEEGRLTYVTRSALWGFPDYTTVQYGDGVLKLFGRARFGGSDLGVNAARLGDVISAVQG